MCHVQFLETKLQTGHLESCVIFFWQARNAAGDRRNYLTVTVAPYSRHGQNHLTPKNRWTKKGFIKERAVFQVLQLCHTDRIHRFQWWLTCGYISLCNNSVLQAQVKQQQQHNNDNNNNNNFLLECCDIIRGGHVTCATESQTKPKHIVGHKQQRAKARCRA